MHPARPYRVLVIDDHEPSRDLVARAFDAVGWAVTTLAAPPSPAAVAALAPDAVVLDYWFGREPLAIPFLEALRAQPATARTPVLLVTAAVTAIKRDRERIERLANAVLFKPHGIWDLLAAVDACRTAVDGPAAKAGSTGWSSSRLPADEGFAVSRTDAKKTVDIAAGYATIGNNQGE